jgi:hypothetical protein
MTTANTTFLTFSGYENVTAYDLSGEYMVTFLKADFGITNYSTYDNALFELTPRIMKVINGVESGLIATASANCSITSNFHITCIETKVDDANTSQLKMVLEPASAKTSHYVTAQLSSTPKNATVTANIIETPIDTAYSLGIDCPKDPADGYRYFEITGYTEQKIEGALGLDKGTFEVQLECVYMEAEDWCYYFYSGANDPGYFTDSTGGCTGQANYNNLGMGITWENTAVTGLYKFTIAVGKDTTFGGCAGRGGIIEERAHLRFHFNQASSDYEIFEFVITKEANDACKNN